MSIFGCSFLELALSTLVSFIVYLTDFLTRNLSFVPYGIRSDVAKWFFSSLLLRALYYSVKLLQKEGISAVHLINY